MKPDAILATNTSSIPLEQLRDGLQRPERLVGMHFFNPVSRMQLVEVVQPRPGIAADVLADARAFLGRIDRLPAPVKSAPGFLVNRALTPYLLEALVMLGRAVQQGDHRQGRRRFRHADGPDRACRRGRARHLPARRRDAAAAASIARCPRFAAMAARTRSPRASSAARPARVFMSGRTARPSRLSSRRNRRRI